MATGTGFAQVGKGYAGRAAKASGKKEALALAEEGGEALAAVFTKVHCPVARSMS